MKAWPRITTLAVRSVLSPRISLSLAFRRPWSQFGPVVLVLAGVVQRGRNQVSITFAPVPGR